MLAYPLYDIPNTCGPDWDICAEFDFERQQAKPITPSNVEERATTLLHQYRSKALHFKHNNVLIPLGDDFKYKTLEMTLDIFNNYQTLFDHINSNPKFQVDIKFATLSEYFNAIHSSMDASLSFPVYNGDFFTYSDRENEYWSGYFTTRPYVKSLSRQTESEIKYTESLYALAKVYSNIRYDWQQGFTKLSDARKTLSLYQHHDGITGTSKAYVSRDYANQLHNSLWKLKELTIDLLNSFLFPTQSNTLSISLADSKGQDSFKLSTTNVISISKDTVIRIILYNPLVRQRTQLVRIIVNNFQVELVDSSMNNIEYSVFPIFNGNTMSSNTYELLFIVNASPLSIQSYYLKEVTTDSPSTSIYSDLPLAGEKSFLHAYTKSNSANFPGGITVIENDIIKV
jgi:hypothetical protein